MNARGNPAVTPFAEVLTGAMVVSLDATVTVDGATFLDASDSGTSFALEFGGGADIRVSDRFGIRASADYIRVFEGEGANVFRLGVGVVFPF